MNFGLKESTIQKINSVFERYSQVDEAVIFGSRVKGNYENGSDIDLTLKGKNLSLQLLFSIENDLDDLLLPYKIDLSIYNKIENQDLIDHICRVGISFYKRIQKND
ncbi:MAG: nucleotidyltransferase domain-containing protein [Cyclobacteriaceae bacterium]